MAARNYSNTAAPTALLADITAGDTSISVASTDGYPDAPFTIAINRGTVDEELILVGTKGANTFSDCTRGYDGTTATSHSTSDPVEHSVAAIDFKESGDHLNATDPHSSYLNVARHAATEHQTAQYADESVTEPILAEDAVSSRTIGDDQVERAHIAPDAVGPDEIEDGAVAEAALGSGAATRTKVGAGVLRFNDAKPGGKVYVSTDPPAVGTYEEGDFWFQIES